jgi:hypothetical protein
MKKKNGTLSFYPYPLFLLHPFAARKQCLCSSFLSDSAGMGRRETKIIISYMDLGYGKKMHLCSCAGQHHLLSKWAA